MMEEEFNTVSSLVDLGILERIDLTGKNQQIIQGILFNTTSINGKKINLRNQFMITKSLKKISIF